MKTKTSNILFFIAAAIGVAAVLWLMLSLMIFAFRHPWATDMERFLHIPDAVMLKKIPYEEMRGRN